MLPPLGGLERVLRTGQHAARVAVEPGVGAGGPLPRTWPFARPSALAVVVGEAELLRLRVEVLQHERLVDDRRASQAE